MFHILNSLLNQRDSKEVKESGWISFSPADLGPIFWSTQKIPKLSKNLKSRVKHLRSIVVNSFSYSSSGYFIYLFFNINIFILIGGWLLYNIVLVLPYINMNLPQVYTCSPSWTPLPPPFPYHPSGSSQCTSPRHPVSCIEVLTSLPHPQITFLFNLSSSYSSL